MNDDPVPLPITQHEIDEAVDAALDDSNRTVPASRRHMFAFDDASTDVEVTALDPIVRLEQKLDSVIRNVDALRRRVESIDLVLARIVNR